MLLILVGLFKLLSYTIMLVNLVWGNLGNLCGNLIELSSRVPNNPDALADLLHQVTGHTYRHVRDDIDVDNIGDRGGGDP